MNRMIVGGIALIFFVGWLLIVPALVDHVQSASVVNAQTEPDEESQPKEFDPDLVVLGEDIFERTAGGVGCAACHGIYAMGDLDNAPNLRGSDEARIRGGLDQVSAMEFLVNQTSDNDIAALAEYLQYLGTLTPGKFTRERSGDFNVAELRFPTGVEAQLIVENRNRSTCTFESNLDGFETVELGRTENLSFLWTTPEAPVTFEAGCQETPDVILTIVVEEPTQEESQ